MKPCLRILRLPHGEGLPLPKYQTEHAAGFDLVAAVGEKEPVVLSAGAQGAVPTGLVFELPYGYEAQVRPRSGLALKHGVTVLNSPGTVDADYRGEVKVVLINLSEDAFRIARGDRIAQFVITPVTTVEITEVSEVSETSRGQSGFGSTG